MKIWYDEKADAMYIRFSPSKYHVSRNINDSLIVDMDRRGRVVGLEILDASETLPGGAVSHLDFEVHHPEHAHR